MSTAVRRTLRRSLTAAIVLLVCIAALDIASAASLDLRAGQLMTFDAAVERCYGDVSLAPVTKDSQLVALVGFGVDPACDGQAVEVTVFGASGAPLTTGREAVAQPTFTIPLASGVPDSSVEGVAFAVEGFQLPESVPVTTFEIEITNDWGTALQARVDVESTSVAEVPWSFELALNTYPFNGSAECGYWGDADVTVAGGLLTATPLSTASTISTATPREVHFCLERSEADAGEVIPTVTTRSNSANAFCADVKIYNPGLVPITWEVALYVPDYQPDQAYGGTGHYSVHADSTYDAQTSTLTASGVDGVYGTEIVPPGETADWYFCVENMIIPPSSEPVFVNASYTGGPWYDGGSGHGSYNGQIAVITDSEDAIPWEVTIDFAAEGLVVPTEITSVWGDVDYDDGTEFDPVAGTLSVRGTAAGNRVSVSDPKTVQFGAKF